MLLSLLFKNILGPSGNPGQLGALTLDVTLDESHEFGAEVTEFPIEGGAIITDHVRLQPRSFTVNGFVTDSPLQTFGIVLGRSRTASAFFLLEQMWERRTPLILVSQLRIYRNMVIESLIIPKTREQALRFTCTFREVVTVSGQNLLIPGDKKVSKAASAAGGGVDKLTPGNVARPAIDGVGIDAGRQAASTARPEVQESASILYGIFN